MKTIFLLAATTAATLPLAGSQTESAPYQAELVTRQIGATMRVSGLCRSVAGPGGRFRYELEAERIGPGGHSVSSQGGHFALAARQEVLLAQTTLGGLGPEAHYRLRLRVYDAAGQPVAQDSVNH